MLTFDRSVSESFQATIVAFQCIPQARIEYHLRNSVDLKEFRKSVFGGLYVGSNTELVKWSVRPSDNGAPRSARCGPGEIDIPANRNVCIVEIVIDSLAT